MTSPIPVDVECHAGYKGAETPRSFTCGDRRYEIVEILDRWYQGSRDPTVPACDYFKVRVAEGGLFMIRMDSDSLRWYLVDALQ